MKKYILNNPRYLLDLKNFRGWLGTLNYSKSTVYNSPNYVKELLHYLEQNECFNYSHLSTELIESYFDYLQSRAKENQDGALSFGSLKKHQNAIVNYVIFLKKTGEIVPSFSFPFLENQSKQITVLTTEEVRLLFDNCTNDLMGKRTKAMLCLYYNCGLRKLEGINLNVEDIDLVKELIFIRKSKTHRQRYVPMSKGAKVIIEDYLFSARELILPSNSNENAFLITNIGTRFSVSLAPYFLKQLLLKIGNPKLTEKTTLHVLRHSIATHLLKNGMSLENIALFLGHRSLDSTQIYTHIL